MRYYLISKIYFSESLPPLVLSEMTETGQEGESEVPTLPLFVGSGRRAALEAAARLKEDTLSEDGSQLYLDDSSQDLDYQESMDMNGGRLFQASFPCHFRLDYSEYPGTVIRGRFSKTNISGVSDGS